MFEPFDHAANVKAHPEDYFSLAEVLWDALIIDGIRKAQTVAELRGRYRLAFLAAKEDNDEWFLERIAAVKDKRKAQLGAR